MNATHHVIRPTQGGDPKVIAFEPPSQPVIFSGTRRECERFVEVEIQRREDSEFWLRIVGSVFVLFLAIWSTLYACGAL